ncbi:MAG: hypothetical protein EXS52_01250 [Candidatus Staskawiczbacteria bacterium]|nr:hypothetical protein [Candidatus Staskawiczbacteria bacterium]
MTQEEKLVVNPLEEYFKDPNRSGATWVTKNKPRFGTSATGWDLQMERKNQVLLIEAKYISGPFASAFAGLVIAPLSNRPEKMMSNKKRSWSSVICWAIGCRNRSDVYQILFDYLVRNLDFWKCYSEMLRVKYIYFVDNKKVAKISFSEIINLAIQYQSSSDKSLKERRLKAEDLLAGLNFK